jgi:hypothetical protein
MFRPAAHTAIICRVFARKRREIYSEKFGVSRSFARDASLATFTLPTNLGREISESEMA